MPAGELFELVRPAVVVISIVLSTFVLASARKRFSIYLAFAWAVGTLFLPLVVLPLYLVVILFWRRPARSHGWGLLLALAYGAILLVGVGLYLNHENLTVDAHLARANQAKLVEDHDGAIREYREALTIENNPHTHKLLAIELVNAGRLDEAMAEFRLAQQGGEPISCPVNTPKCEEIVKGISGLNR